MSDAIAVLGKHTRILLIEDDDEDAFLVERMLKGKATRYTSCERARNSSEALEMLDSREYDAIIMDFYLGSETAQNVIQMIPEKKSNVAIIILTGGDPTLADEASFGMGADFLISKEKLDEAALERSIRYAIRNRDQQNRMKNFSRLVAHDVKGPLGNISNALALLRINFEDGGNGDVGTLFDITERECERMLNLLSDLENYSLSQDGELSLAPVELGRLLERSKSNIKMELERKSAVVEAAELPTLRVDEGLLVHVFQNLIQNGIKYNRSRVPRVSVDSIVHSGWCYLRFSDNGIGINRGEAPIVFQPLTRLHGSSEFVGTGLGLAICKEFVERHGGRIWVESSGVEGEGSTFVVQLRCG